MTNQPDKALREEAENKLIADAVVFFSNRDDVNLPGVDAKEWDAIIDMLKDFAQSQLSEAHKEIEDLRKCIRDFGSILNEKNLIIKEAQARIKELEAPKRLVSDEEIKTVVEENFKGLSDFITDHEILQWYKDLIVTVIQNYGKLSPRTGESEGFKLAMDYINVCPCDPDITPEQLEAWNKLRAFLKEFKSQNP